MILFSVKLFAADPFMNPRIHLGPFPIADNAVPDYMQRGREADLVRAMYSFTEEREVLTQQIENLRAEYINALSQWQEWGNSITAEKDQVIEERDNILQTQRQLEQDRIVLQRRITELGAQRRNNSSLTAAFTSAPSTLELRARVKELENEVHALTEMRNQNHNTLAQIAAILQQNGCEITLENGAVTITNLQDFRQKVSALELLSEFFSKIGNKRVIFSISCLR